MPLRAALREACRALDEVGTGWIGGEAHVASLRKQFAVLRRDVSFAIVVFDERERDAVAIREASRAAAIRAALQVNATLASAYEDRWASPRTVLAACHAVARVIELLHRISPAGESATRWN